ncbi:MAG: hypothetical protein FWH43_04925 [Endomicrobia bacterium]|nr:hypothetical protein [Endomicrobiia bacterium]
MIQIFILISGVCAAFMHALFLRELLSVFQGNELIIGIILAHSVFAFASGVFVSSKIKKLQASDKTASVFTAAAALFFVSAFFFIMNIRSILHIPIGGGISLKTTFIYVFFAVFPSFFLQSTAVFSAIKSKANEISIRMPAALLFIGFSAGGILFSSVMYKFGGFNIMLITAVCLFAASVASSASAKSAKVFFLAGLIPVFCGLFLNIGDLEKKILRGNFSSSEIVEYKHTSYGQTALVQKNREHSLLVNNIMQFSSPDNDILNSEDFGHIPVLHSEYPENVLIIGGAAKYLPMILEHKVKRVDYLEPDAAVLEIMKYGIPHIGYVFKDKRVHVYNENVRVFLNKNGRKYNLILVGLPAPVNLTLNGFYTKEFFQAAKKRMKRSGFIAVKLQGTMAFSTYIMAELNKSVMEAMGGVFKNTNIIPGSQNILIASERKMPYRIHIKKRLYKMQETTLVLSKYYLDDRMDTEHTRWLKNELDKIDDDDNFLMNSDWNPKAMLLSVLHSQSAFSPYLALFADKARKYVYLIIVAAVIIFFLSKSICETTAFVSGASSTWLFIMLLFAAQILSGEIYKTYGLLFSLFMLGILAGLAYAWKAKNALPLNKKMFYGELLFLLLIILLLLIFKLYSINIYIIRILLFGAGFTAGMEFAYLMKISDLFGKSVNNHGIYIAEISGILFSALAGGCFLFAAWGMEKSLLFILFMKFLIFCRWADLKKRGL